MAELSLLQADYSHASVRDIPRHLLPKGAVWKVTDWIPNHGAPLRKRGPWSYGSLSLAGSSSAPAVAYAPFSSGPQTVSIGSNGHLYKVTPTTATDMGSACVPISRPAFYKDMLIVPSDGASSVYKYTGGGPAALGGTPPKGKFVDTFKSRVMLGLDRQLFWSDPGNPEGWNVAQGFTTVTQPLTGVAAMRNIVVVFSVGGCERIRGDIPPPNGDMVREPLFEEGCFDARSIVKTEDKLIWANANGIWITDGAAIDNLTALGGMLQYWLDLMAAKQPTWNFAGGWLQGHYIISITDGATFVDALACEVSSKTWFFLDNFSAKMFCEAYGVAPELYMGLADEGRVGAGSGIFRTGTADADGTPIQPRLETGFYRGKPGSRRWKSVYVGADLQAAPGTYLEVGYVVHPEATAYTICPDRVLPNVGVQNPRTKIPIGVASDGIALQIRQVGPSTDSMLFDIEADVHDREGSR